MSTPQRFTSVGSLSRLNPSASTFSVYTAIGDLASHLWGNQAVLRELLNYVESIEYDCECGLAGSLSLLKSYINESSKVQELITLCKDRAIAVFILGHMLDVTTRRIDPEYRNPWEMAVVTYLHVITQARPDLKIPAMAASRRLMNSFWIEKYITTYLQ